MFTEFIKSLFLIFMAEMGDKTQILAMVFATQFPVGKVLLGIFIGSFLNHGIAVALGSYLSNVIPLDTIQIIAGFLFVGFALWTLKAEGEEEESDIRKGVGPVFTVAAAFFIGELGDKTQLTAITLAVDANFPLFVLFGTVTGMILTGGLGIFVGSKIGDKIPEFALKIASAVIFMFFGTLKLYNTLPEAYINPTTVVVFFAIVGISAYVLIKPALQARKKGEKSLYKEKAAELYEYTHKIQQTVENICLGEEKCGKCAGANCMIGYTKGIIENAIRQGDYTVSELKENMPEFIKKNFDVEKVIQSLSDTVTCLKKYEGQYDKKFVINQVRQVLERILFEEQLEFEGDIDKYLQLLKEKDKVIANEIIHQVDAFNNN
jgi:putative Ca2+/H+ antiporter (TMEM165/GDT1 family)